MTELFIKPGRRLKDPNTSLLKIHNIHLERKTLYFSHVLEPLKTCGKQTANFKCR